MLKETFNSKKVIISFQNPVNFIRRWNPLLKIFMLNLSAPQRIVPTILEKLAVTIRDHSTHTKKSNTRSLEEKLSLWSLITNVSNFGKSGRDKAEMKYKILQLFISSQ